MRLLAALFSSFLFLILFTHDPVIAQTNTKQCAAQKPVPYILGLWTM
jgi:hypothetical protein